MQVSTLNGVRVYNLSSAAKTVPGVLTEKKKKELNKTDEGFRRRIQLLQDFGFDTAAQRVRFSKDGVYIAATGTYPPNLKVFDVRELSMKFERRMDAEAVQFQVCGLGGKGWRGDGGCERGRIHRAVLC
jgi:ribosome biogenesis protein ENP2